MTGDDMGILLATDDVMGSEGKRKIEDVERSEQLRSPDSSWSACSMWGKDKTEFDVCEIFSRPRVCQMARGLGSRGGYSLNRDAKNMHTNKSWNFLEKKDQVKLITLLARIPTQLLTSM